MTIITLTRQDTPSRPVTLNTDFIAAVNPLRKVLPDPSSQTMQTKTVYAGSEVVLSNGTKYNVVEAYPDVVAKLSAEVSYPTGPMLKEEDVQPIPKDNIPSLPNIPIGTVLAASGVGQVANTVTTQGLMTDLIEEGHREEQASPRETLRANPDYEGPVSEPDELPVSYEPPAGTPLTEEELQAVAEHEAKADPGTNPVSDAEPEKVETFADKIAAKKAAPKKAPAKAVKPLGNKSTADADA